MKTIKIFLILTFVFISSFFLQSCSEYYTYVNIPLSYELATTFNNPNPTSTQCMVDNPTYKDLKDELSKNDREVVAVAARTIYDKTNTSGSVRVSFYDLNNNLLFTRDLSGSLLMYQQVPLIIILTPDERVKVNTALKTPDGCFVGKLNVLNVTPQNYDFKIAVDVVIGIKYSINQ